MKTVGSQSLWPSRLTKMYRNLYTLAINGRVSNSSKNAKYKNRKQNNGRSRRPSAKRQRATRTEACGIFSACFNFGLPLSPTMSCTEERVYNPSRSRFREEKKLDRPRIAIRWICDGGWKRGRLRKPGGEPQKEKWETEDGHGATWPLISRNARSNEIIDFMKFLQTEWMFMDFTILAIICQIRFGGLNDLVKFMKAKSGWWIWRFWRPSVKFDKAKSGRRIWRFRRSLAKFVEAKSTWGSWRFCRMATGRNDRRCLVKALRA